MFPTLVANWRAVLKHAWSVKIMLLAMLLDVFAAVAPFLSLPIHPALLAAAGAVATGGAFIARFVAQKPLAQPPADPLWTNGDDE